MIRPQPAGSCQLADRRTRAVAIFRTTPVETVCPNFYVLAHANGCGFAPACSYCYLKSSLWYLDKPRAYANVGALLAEVSRWIARDDLESYILNSGNLSDSLSLDAARPLMGDLVELFRREATGRPHTLLLVTKGGREACAPLLAREACDRVVVSFSVNADAAAARYETGAPPPAERLAAAALLAGRGWRIRLRIDPMIDGFDYRPLTAAIRDLRPERVTLGCLRAEHNLDRHVEPGILDALVPPPDGTGMARYPVPVRLALYRPVVAELRGTTELALCEETPDLWHVLDLDAEARRCNCAG